MEDRQDYNFFLYRLLGDSLMVLGSWFLAYLIRFDIIPGGQENLFFVFARTSVLVLVLFIYYLNRNQLYQSMRIIGWVEEFRRLGLATTQAIISLILILYFFYPERISRLSILLFSLLVTVLLNFERMAIRNILIALRIRGRNLKSVLVAGHGTMLDRYVQVIRSSPGLGLQVIGQVDGGDQPITDLEQFSISLPEAVRRFRPKTIVIGYPAAEHHRAVEMVDSVNDMLPSIYLINDAPYALLGTRITELQSISMLQLNHISLSHFDQAVKRSLDFFLSLAGLTALAPFLLLIGAIVKCSSPGPVLFRQIRVTENNRVFILLKYRTMTVDSTSGEAGPTRRNDSRITPVGRFLRRTSLDELPQLFNVLIGDMSLIGPRPERPELTTGLEARIPGYALRHKMKAGISGWAQVNGLRGDTSIEERIRYDLYYIRNWSHTLDLKILILTFFKGFINKNAY